MEASVEPRPRGPDWMPITPKTGSLFHAETQSPQPIELFSSPDPDNADAALLLLGIAAPDPERVDIGADRAQLLLEPWAVQTALRRRRGGNPLTERELDEIRRCTRDPDSLRWPRGIIE